MKNISLFILSLIAVASFTACSSPGLSQDKVKREYFTNGQVRTEFIMTDNTEQNGILKRYGYSGELTSTVNIKNGVKDGMEVWYDIQKREIRKVPYVNGRIHGIMIELYENGDTMAEIPFQYGIKHGSAFAYRKDGSVYKQVEYQNGKIVN